jgi:hypothetical protein
MAVNPNEYTSPTAGTIKLGTKSLAGTEGIDALTGTASEAAQPLYYPQNTRLQQSDYAATDQMSNVGAALFDASTSYQSFFDKYKNVEGGLAPLDPKDEGFLQSVYYTAPEPPATPPPPPPPAASTPPEILSPSTGIDDPFSPNFQDPFAVDDPTVTADQSEAMPFTGGPDFFSRDDISEGQVRAGMQPGTKTASEALAGMGEGITSLGGFLSAASTPSTLANMIEGAAAALSGRTAPAPQSFLGRIGNPQSFLGSISNLFTPAAAPPAAAPSANPGSFSGEGADASVSADAASYSDMGGAEGDAPTYSGIGLD